MTNKMWVLRESESSPPISIHEKPEQADGNGKRMGLQKFEVVPAIVEVRILTMEEIVSGEIK